VTEVRITKKNLNKFVDKKVFEISLVDKKPQVGVVSGLAWTAVGGDVLTIEAIKIRGKGGLQLTGSLGDVMKESVRIAHSVVKILIDARKLKVPSSAIPHDNRVAMTGEVTLTGKVLPIGGLKEKLIAAYKAGVKKALIPIKNYERDLDDIPDEVKENIKIVGVSNVEEVLNEALLK